MSGDKNSHLRLADRPAGRQFDRIYSTTADQLTMSKEKCDVRVGSNHLIASCGRSRYAALTV
jgi:hypothetical protein